MAGSKYLTVPEELLGTVAAGEAYYRGLGYRIYIEKRDAGFPYIPAFVAKRSPTNCIVEVTSKASMDRVRHWTRFCRSCSADTRFVLCIPSSVEVEASVLESLRAERVGLLKIEKHGSNMLLTAHDLAMSVFLPELQNLPLKLRKILGPVYEKYEEGNWRESFSDACLVLEDECRDHLKKGVNSARLIVLNANGNPRNLTVDQIDRMTLGQLLDCFNNMKSRNYAESMVAKGVKSINPDRIGVVHKKYKPAVERRLRRNVGKHMWTVVTCVIEMKK